MKLENGVYAALLTPLLADLSCNKNELVRHAKDLLHRGCHGVVLFGTTGEGASFSTAEKLDALSELVTQGISPNKIIMANGSANVPDSVDLIQGCMHFGCSLFLLSPPCFYKNISDEGVVAYYSQILQLAPSAQILLYHIPQLTGISITCAIIHALKRAFPQNIVGIKESEGNPAFAKELIHTFKDIKVFVGKEKFLSEGMKEGAAGAICGLANLYPEEIVSLYEQKPCELPLIARGVHFIVAFKAIMESRLGKSWRLVRPPLC